MGLRIFEIEFDDNPSRTYFAGQNIKGKVIVEIDQVEKKIQELVLRLWGKAEVSWVDPKKGKQKTPRPKTSATPEIRISQSISKDQRTSEKVFSNEETYFDRRYTILEKKDSENLVIQPGRNSYPFEITIPSGIPSSFEGEYGHIKYFLEATIKRPAGQYDHNSTSQINIKGILDLNTDPQALDKPEVSQEIHLCCLCFKNGPVGFNFGILGNSGVISGDKVEFLSDIYNMSDAREVSIKLKLVQITTYHVQHECKVCRKDLLKLKGPSVNRGGTGTWTGDFIQIPEGIPPTRLAGRCNLISIDYSIEITLEAPRGKKVEAQLPLVIGTVGWGVKLDEMISNLNLKKD